MSEDRDRLAPILHRKARENARRHAHLGLHDPHLLAEPSRGPVGDPGPLARASLRRAPGAPVHVIAEVKFASPSEGVIRPRAAGEGVRIAKAYVRAGATAVSVLCDRAGFGGGVLELRRVARAVAVPVLFKEFVLDPLQVSLARAAGASMVLLLVRALDDARLTLLCRACFAAGLEPVVEAASLEEVERALATDARVIGVNARDLGSFTLDADRAERALRAIPSTHVRVFMSGVATPAALQRLGELGADAALVGTALMRAPDPGVALAALLARPS